MNYPALRHEVGNYQRLREHLLELFPDIDHDTIRDTLEGATSLREIIAALIRSALFDEALTVALGLRLAEMKTRLVRFEERGAKKRRLALEAMSEAGLQKIEECDFTASTRIGSPALMVVAAAVIPKSYWRPQPPKLDRQTLLKDLKSGTDVPGAALSNAPSILVVRTK
jgi:hypothetical protein